MRSRVARAFAEKSLSGKPIELSPEGRDSPPDHNGLGLQCRAPVGSLPDFLEDAGENETIGLTIASAVTPAGLGSVIEMMDRASWTSSSRPVQTCITTCTMH